MTHGELIAMAERHVLLGQELIYRQQQIVARLAESGASTELAIGLLDLFQSMQRIHVEHLDRLRDQ